MSLSLNDLCCIRGDRLVFDGFSLKLTDGQVALVRGSNGSGKTSLLRLIAGLLKPAGGTITWDAASDEKPLQSQVHFLGHLDAIKPALSVRETLKFWSAMKGGSDDVTAALQLWNLTSLANLPCGILSAGQRKRVALAQLDLTERPLWLLDEPTGPLDEVGVQLLMDAVVRQRSRGGVTLIATHRNLYLEGAIEVNLSATRQARSMS